MRRAAPILVVFVCTALTGCGVRPRPGAGVAPQSVAVAASAPTPATLSNPKIAPALTAMARRVNAAANGTRAATFFNALIHVNHEGEIEVYIHVTQVAPAVAQALSEAGITNIRVSRPLQVYQGWASPRALGRIAALPQVVRITPPAYRLPKSGGS